MQRCYLYSNRLNTICNELSARISDRIEDPEYKGKCPKCGEEKEDIKIRRMSCSYVDQDSNYLESCMECYDEIQSYWEERWRDYYSSIF